MILIINECIYVCFYNLVIFIFLPSITEKVKALSWFSRQAECCFAVSSFIGHDGDWWCSLVPWHPMLTLKKAKAILNFLLGPDLKCYFEGRVISGRTGYDQAFQSPYKKNVLLNYHSHGRRCHPPNYNRKQWWKYISVFMRHFQLRCGCCLGLLNQARAQMTVSCQCAKARLPDWRLRPS